MESGSRGPLSLNSEYLARTAFRGRFDPPSFRLALSRKDIGLATDLGREFDVPMPVANLVEQLSVQAVNRGWADKDTMITFQLQEETAGVTGAVLRTGPAIDTLFCDAMLHNVESPHRCGLPACFIPLVTLMLLHPTPSLRRVGEIPFPGAALGGSDGPQRWGGASRICAHST